MNATMQTVNILGANMEIGAACAIIGLCMFVVLSITALVVIK
jgi:hypothetical protein